MIEYKLGDIPYLPTGELIKVLETTDHPQPTLWTRLWYRLTGRRAHDPGQCLRCAAEAEAERRGLSEVVLVVKP